MIPMRAVLAFLALAVPVDAGAQQRSAEEIQAQIEACTEGVDVAAVTARAEKWAADAGYEAKVAALCAADDGDGAAAYAEETQAAFYAQDAEAEKLRACMAGVLGEEAMSPGDVCEQ
jgi:hypothetical protein